MLLMIMSYELLRVEVFTEAPMPYHGCVVDIRHLYYLFSEMLCTFKCCR